MQELNQVAKIKSKFSGELCEQLEKFKGQKNFDISITNAEKDIYFLYTANMDETLQFCEKLKLYIGSDQEASQLAFDQFCSYLKDILKNLQVLQFRYYNKRILNIDSLLEWVKNLKEVELDLQDFCKLDLKEDKNYQDYQIECLTLNLFNTTFKENNINGLMKFINSLSKLKYLKFSIDKQRHLKILEEIENKQIQIDLALRKVDYEFCDQLKRIIDEKQIKLEKIHFYQALIGCYLEYINFGNNIQLKLINQNYGSYNIVQDQNYPIDLLQISEKDSLLLKKSGFLAKLIQDKIKQNNVTIKIDLLGQKSGVFEFIFSKTNQLFRNISFVNYHHRNYQEIKKSNDFWYFEFYITQQIKLKYLLKCSKEYLNNLQLSLSLELIQNEDFLVEIYKILIQFKYLIFFRFSLKVYYQIQHDQGLEIPFANIIQQKSQDRLRFFAYQKSIYSLLPIPQQIFFDLIQDN